MKNTLIYTLLTFCIYSTSPAQENYEIQVYASPTTQKRITMAELHSNYTLDGEKKIKNGVLPTNHSFHETIEITHGFTPWFEVGFYFFNAIGDNHRTNYVGSHIRPRVTAPESWHLNFGLSLSIEGGFQKREYSEDIWSTEIRPIIDKQFGKLYMAFNPTLDKSLKGANAGEGFIFSPNLKIDYAFTKKIVPGIEYYGSLGAIDHFDSYQVQQHAIFLCADVLAWAKWELNFGYGFGFTNSTDNAIFKIILGRKF